MKYEKKTIKEEYYYNGEKMMDNKKQKQKKTGLVSVWYGVNTTRIRYF